MHTDIYCKVADLSQGCQKKLDIIATGLVIAMRCIGTVGNAAIAEIPEVTSYSVYSVNIGNRAINKRTATTGRCIADLHCWRTDPDEK